MRIFILSLSILLFTTTAYAQKNLPIIDMHLHAAPADDNGPPPLGLCVPVLPNMPPLGPNETWSEVFLKVVKEPPCSDPIWSPTTDEEVMNQTIKIIRERNIIGVLSGPPDRVIRWKKEAPEHLIPSVQFRIGREKISPDSMRNLFKSGNFEVFGEISNQYAGIAPDDPRMEPYWSLAEELNIPVAIHIGGGPPGFGQLSSTNRARLSNPLLLEDVLKRHPRLRVSVMHFGSPFVDEMIAILRAYPQVYVDIASIQWLYPRKYFYRQLQMFIDAGFGKRIMFGSDQMNWPGVIEPAIEIVEEAPFLTEEQKRDIFYNNAARFLRLSKEEIARHHNK